MGHIFRLKRAGAVATKTTIVGWSNSTATTYNHGYVDGISDATTTQNEITLKSATIIQYTIKGRFMSR